MSTVVPEAPTPPETPPGTSPPPTRGGSTTRRDQRRATHRKLLDATLACLVELGYAGTTTPVITQRAGVSSGALFNHFATKDDLMLAAVGDLLPRMMATTNEQMTRDITAGERPFVVVVERFWQVSRSPVGLALGELFAAARTNPRLRSALAEAREEYGRALESLSAALFPDLAGWERHRAFSSFAWLAIQGFTATELAFGPGLDLADTRHLLVEALEAIAATATRPR
ncbi:MAG TPA: TetR/AcrR family transcriptional regulator [Acidimicrobiales bacterium]|nr:TetR/AcrR family transcriptional regulator [Acidimicrobiales bacterium]